MKRLGVLDLDLKTLRMECPVGQTKTFDPSRFRETGQDTKKISIDGYAKYKEDSDNNNLRSCGMIMIVLILSII